MFKERQSLDSGSTVPHKQGSIVPEGYRVRTRFYGVLEAAKQKEDSRLGGWRVPGKASRPCFLGSGELAKLSWRTVLGVC